MHEWRGQEGRVCMSGEESRGECVSGEGRMDKCACMGKVGWESVHKYKG